MTINPYVVGQWVRGEKFYGREALIGTILNGNRNCLWVLGTRRIGKTSLLKQVELVAAKSPELGYFPVFWDFQGAESPEDLHEGFSDSLLDAEDRLEECGIALEEIEAGDLFSSLRKLRRALGSKKLKLLLLCDEVEELIGLNKREPILLRKLRRAMQSHDDIRSVLASKIKLWELSGEKADTSPFLEGFTPPLYIQPLENDEALALIQQVNLPSDSRPRLDQQAVETVRERCNNHPYLIQLLCERFMELEDLQAAIERLAADPMVKHFFSVDFEMLTPTDRDILHAVAERGGFTVGDLQQRLSVTAASLEGCLHRLEHLGYLRRGDGQGFELANHFFRRWFLERSSAPVLVGDPTAVSGSAVTVMRAGTELEVFDDRYELREKLGAGSMGVVYKAHDRMLQETMALKLLKPEYSTDEHYLERFRREILLGRDLEHPNILKVYHLGDFQGRRYLTMKLATGPNLGHVIHEGGPLPIDRVLDLSTQLAAALQAAHENGVVHRDIKPENIMIDEDGRPLLTDFGVARLRDRAAMTTAGVFLGTPAYASPEQANLRPADERSDLYALGIVIFEMVAGRRPFVATAVTEVLKMHRTEPPPDLAQLRSDTPPALCEIVARCLDKDPETRFGSARELREALEAVGR